MSSTSINGIIEVVIFFRIFINLLSVRKKTFYLNPLRDGVVSDFEALNRYKWFGHSVLMGKHMLNGQVKEEVFARFGWRPSSALQPYLRFIT
ncbi:MAG: hypothetical protein OEM02_07640 [Desulfobulbaceae bacterium]|nr:hypothetical protein [Desulfobulbaceae bacterium]